LRSRKGSAALVVAALVVAPLGALTACGPAGGGSAAGAGATPPAATSPPAGSASPAGATAHTVNVCTVISAVQAARLTGQPYTVAASQAGDWASQCAYNNSDATAQGVNVTLFDTNAASTWSVVHSGDISDISGLGDKAFWDNDNTLYVMSGTDLIQVNGLSSEQDSEALAKPVLDALH
jgi:hypothetical protein